MHKIPNAKQMKNNMVFPESDIAVPLLFLALPASQSTQPERHLRPLLLIPKSLWSKLISFFLWQQHQTLRFPGGKFKSMHLNLGALCERVRNKITHIFS